MDGNPIGLVGYMCAAPPPPPLPPPPTTTTTTTNIHDAGSSDWWGIQRFGWIYVPPPSPSLSIHITPGLKPTSER